MKTNISPIAAALLGAATLSGPTIGAQAPASDGQQAITFRAQIDYVEVDTRVVDADGRFVGGLSIGDFEVREDGKPQQVSLFSLVHIPERKPWPLFAGRPVGLDVRSNVTGFSGRVYLIVLDDLQTTPLLAVRTRSGARGFVERHMSSDDLAAILYTSGRTDAAQGFTSNRRLLIAAIEKFSGSKLPPVTLDGAPSGPSGGRGRERGDVISDPGDTERAFGARRTVDSLARYVQTLEGVRGRRKALLYFSEGVDFDISNVFSRPDALMVIDATRDAIAAAARANVAIYGIDVRGLGASTESLANMASSAEHPMSALSNDVRRGQDSLRVLSNETGGFALVNDNDVPASFERIVQEASSYYVLAYNPSNDRRDGRFRKIDVRVKRPGVTVRARRGYVAPRGAAEETPPADPAAAPEELRAATSSPIPLTGLALEATAAVFRGAADGGTSTVVVSTLIAGRDLPLLAENGTSTNDLDIAIVASDAHGTMFPGVRHTINLSLTPDTVERVRAAGFRVISTIDLPPGRYQLRVGAHEAHTRRAGSVVYDVDVPDFSRPAIAMSGLALAATRDGGLVPTAHARDPLETHLPGPMTTQRDFAADDEIALFAEIYGPRAAHSVAIDLTMRAEDGQTVFHVGEERSSTELQDDSGFSARIPLRDVPPGQYLLRVAAQIPSGESAVRETLVRVVSRSQALR